MPKEEKLMTFKCNRDKCQNIPIKMYKYENQLFYICSQHLQEFETSEIKKLTKKKASPAK